MPIHQLQPYIVHSERRPGYLGVVIAVAMVLWPILSEPVFHRPMRLADWEVMGIISVTNLVILVIPYLFLGRERMEFSGNGLFVQEWNRLVAWEDIRECDLEWNMPEVNTLHSQPHPYLVVTLNNGKQYQTDLSFYACSNKKIITLINQFSGREMLNADIEKLIRRNNYMGMLIGAAITILLLMLISYLKNGKI